MDKKLLEEMIQCVSPSGREDALIKKVVEYTKENAEDYIYDNQGSVTVVYNKESNFKVMLAGHSDEISLIVNGYNRDGSLTVGRNGGIRCNLYVGSKVQILVGNHIIYGACGVNGALCKKGDIQAEDLYIDIGAKDEKQAKEAVPLGSYIVHDTDIRYLLDNKATGRAFDDRIGVYITQLAAMKAKELGAKSGIYCTATTGEENTGRGAYSSAAMIKPNVSIIVDVTYSTDYIGASAPGTVEIGNGGVICLGSIPNRKLNALLEETAKELNEPVQFEVCPGRTSTDGDTILRSNEGEPQILFSIPLRYMHSPVEVLSLTDVESMINVLAHFICKLDASVDLKPYKF